MCQTEYQNQYADTHTALRFPLGQTKMLEIYSPPTGMDLIFLAKVFEQNVEFLNYSRRGNGISEIKKFSSLVTCPKIRFCLDTTNCKGTLLILNPEIQLSK